jgi:hypothetical protein
MPNIAGESSGVAMNVAKIFKSPNPVTLATSAVGLGAGMTWIGIERRGMTLQNGVTKRSQKVFALSPGTPLSLGK